MVVIGQGGWTRVRVSWTVLIVCSVVLGACGSSDGDDGDAGQSGDSSTTSTDESTATSADDTTTTAEAAGSTTETEPSTTDESEVATDDADAAKPEVPAAGTGTLTIDGVEIVFTIKECDFDPKPILQTQAITTFAMNAAAEAEGREVNVNASRIELAGRFNDTYGYAYVDDPNDFQTAVIVGTGGSTGEQFRIDGTTYSAGPLPFERTEGVSVVEGVDPGPGSIIFTC